jgi:hypothetical protein
MKSRSEDFRLLLLLSASCFLLSLVSTRETGVGLINLL